MQFVARSFEDGNSMHDTGMERVGWIETELDGVAEEGNASGAGGGGELAIEGGEKSGAAQG